MNMLYQTKREEYKQKEKSQKVDLTWTLCADFTNWCGQRRIHQVASTRTEIGLLKASRFISTSRKKKMDGRPCGVAQAFLQIQNLFKDLKFIPQKENYLHH